MFFKVDEAAVTRDRGASHLPDKEGAVALPTGVAVEQNRRCSWLAVGDVLAVLDTTLKKGRHCIGEAPALVTEPARHIVAFLCQQEDREFPARNSGDAVLVPDEPCAPHARSGVPLLPACEVRVALRAPLHLECDLVAFVVVCEDVSHPSVAADLRLGMPPSRYCRLHNDVLRAQVLRRLRC